MIGYYIPSDEELLAVRQTRKDVFIKIELLNNDKTVTDSMTGNLITDSLNIQSESKQRRSYNCTMYVSDDSYLIGSDRKIWIDKLIRVYYGIRYNNTGEIFWWRVGTFTYGDVNYSYGAIQCEVSLTLLDLMANYDGTKNGQINQTGYNDITGESVYNFKIEAVNENVSDENEKYYKITDIVEQTLIDAGITDYQIEYDNDNPERLGYDLEYSGTVTYCQIWTDLSELTGQWEFFFDVNGKFIWQKIPLKYSEPIAIDNSVISPLYITEQLSASFKNIYNTVEMFGYEFVLTNEDRYVQTSSYSYNSSNKTCTYSISLPLTIKSGLSNPNTSDIQSYITRLDRIAFKIFHANEGTRTYVKITDTTNTSLSFTLQLLTSDGSALPKNSLDTISGGQIIVTTYYNTLNDSENRHLVFNGKTQAYALYEEKDINNPFSTTNLGYKIVKRMENQKLYDNQACLQYAMRECYYSSIMMDTVDLTMIIVPWLEVGNKIEYTSKITGATGQYIIKSISWSTFEGTMNMQLYKFVEDYEFVYAKQNGV